MDRGSLSVGVAHKKIFAPFNLILGQKQDLSTLLGNTFDWSDGVSHPFSTVVPQIAEEHPNGCLVLTYTLYIWTCSTN